MEVITSHINLDFDGFASMIAAQKLHPDAFIVLPSVISKDVRSFLALYRSYFDLKKFQEIDTSKITKLIIVDTSSKNRLGDFINIVDRENIEIVVYDHHSEEDNDIKAHTYEIRKCGACTSILLDKIIEKDIKILPVEATTLAIGIYTDTNCLTFSSTSEEDAKAVAHLLKCGAYLDVISKNVGQALSIKQKEAFDVLVKNIKVYNIKGFDIGISVAEFDEYIDEVAYITYKILSLNEYDAVISIVSIKNRIYIVGRSSNNKINMNNIMKEFDGAGHPEAGSAKLKDEDVSYVEEELLQVLNTHVEPSITAIDIASFPVKTVGEDMILEDVQKVMLRYGYTGLPVTRDDEVVGMVTRRDIEKVIHHGYGHSPVKAYMSKKFFFIQYDTPFKEVQRILVENNIGRLPVLKNGKLVGIVTRTDILKQIFGEEYPTRFKKIYKSDSDMTKQSYSEELDKLSDEVKNILQTVGEIGDNHNSKIFVVGGFVRDLIIGRKNLDIDIVVEGDGIQVAKDLCSHYNGKLKIHDKFKTAIVEISNRLKIDVVTARREYYEHPASLPTVEKGSIRSDLYRRDFTINSMAICLNKNEYGKLIDYFGGQKDLHQGLVRVLYNMSFVEDPTRIIRAIRFAGRYDFKFEDETYKFLLNAINENILDKVSNERMSYELLLILNESNAFNAIVLLIKLGILDKLYPKLNVNQNIINIINKNNDNTERLKYDMVIIYLLILFWNTQLEDAEEILERIKLNKVYKNIIINYVRNKNATLRILNNQNISNFEVYNCLRKFSPEALYLLKNFSNENISDKIDLFENSLKDIRILIDGKNLKELGVKSGPTYKEIFIKVFEAKLNKNVNSLDDEINYVKELINRKVDA